MINEEISSKGAKQAQMDFYYNPNWFSKEIYEKRSQAGSEGFSIQILIHLIRKSIWKEAGMLWGILY